MTVTTMHSRSAVSDAAWAAHRAGLAVVPPKEDGSKRPDGNWKHFQVRRPDQEQMERWYGWDDRHGVGVLCGAVSGNLEMFEFEGRAVDAGLFDQWIDACSDAGLDELLDRVLTGYQEHTPSGGVHLLWRCTAAVPGNTKIARDPDGVVLVETRGEGGFTILAPSGGTVHPTGKPWTLARGGFDTIPTITVDERAALVDLASTLDDYRPDDIAGAAPPPPTDADVVWDEVKESAAAYQSHGSWMDATIDDYCRRTTWRDVLVGWSEVFTRGDVTYWRRPGKDEGHSATTNAKGTDRLINFSSSVPLLEPWDGVGKATSYSRFDVYVATTHNGDRIGAARKLRAQGYGEPHIDTDNVGATQDEPEGDEDELPDVYTLLEKPEEPYDWVVDGFLERHDRVIFTGGEGQGKSTFLRQFGVRVAAGLHPFTEEEITPVRVLIVDLENGERLIRRKIRDLVDMANKGNELERRRLFILPRPQGINLFSPPDLDWLNQRVERYRPDILIIGPLYKMADGDPTEEAHAKAISGAIDAIRVAHRCAVIIEAHSPHGDGKNRPLRPYGASLWLRWPEFGLGITDGGQLIHWRGQRDERAWPAALQKSKVYGEGWPWLPLTEGKAATWAKVKDCLLSAGERLTYREIGERLGVSKSWVEQVVQANKKEWDEIVKGFNR